MSRKRLFGGWSQGFVDESRNDFRDRKSRRLAYCIEPPHNSVGLPTKQSHCEASHQDLVKYAERLRGGEHPEDGSPTKPEGGDATQASREFISDRRTDELCPRSPYADNISGVPETMPTPFGRRSVTSEEVLSPEVEVSGVTVSLDDVDLWQTFYHSGTEMIINRPGRRMFPSVVVSVTGLDPCADYKMLMEIVPADDRRYKYVNNRWTVVGKADPEIRNLPYLHPDSPSSGKLWMQTKISFAKIKITNNKESGEGNILIHSMHKYMAQVTIVRMRRTEHEAEQRLVFPLPLSTFVAVTAYQSENITQMKIRNNPFAKAFRDGDFPPGMHSSPGTTGYNHHHHHHHHHSVAAREGRYGISPMRASIDRRSYPGESMLSNSPNCVIPSPPNMGMTLPGPMFPWSYANALSGSSLTPRMEGVLPPTSPPHGVFLLPSLWNGLSHPNMTSPERTEATYKWLSACATFQAAHARSASIMRQMTSPFVPLTHSRGDLLETHPGSRSPPANSTKLEAPRNAADSSHSLMK